MTTSVVQRDREDELASAALLLQEIVDICKRNESSTLASEIHTRAATSLFHLHQADVRGVMPRARRKVKG